MAFEASVVAAHARAIPAGHWFALVGRPFSDQERAHLALLAPQIERVVSWEAARGVATDPRASFADEADAAEVVELKSRALLAVAPDVLLTAMSDVVDLGLDVFFRAAGDAARRDGIDDETTVRAAAGAAAEAVYRGALADAVDGTAHRFTGIEALFAAGRWPLARIDDTLFVF